MRSIHQLCLIDYFLLPLQFALGQNVEKAFRTGTLVTQARNYVVLLRASCVYCT